MPDKTNAALVADAEPRKPFDIKDYQQTVAGVTGTIHEAQALVMTVEHLLTSPEWKERLPELLTTLDQVGKEGEGLIDYSYRQAITLVMSTVAVVFLLAFLLVRHTLRRSAALRQTQERR